MSRMWKDLRTNFMYWRFRNVTQRRLRLQAWYRRRRQPAPVYRPRGTTTWVYYRSPRRTWLILLAMVAVLTAIQVAPLVTSITWALDSLAVVGAIYWAMRGV